MRSPHGPHQAWRRCLPSPLCSGRSGPGAGRGCCRRGRPSAARRCLHRTAEPSRRVKAEASPGSPAIARRAWDRPRRRSMAPPRPDRSGHRQGVPVGPGAVSSGGYPASRRARTASAWLTQACRSPRCHCGAPGVGRHRPSDDRPSSLDRTSPRSPHLGRAHRARSAATRRLARSPAVVLAPLARRPCQWTTSACPFSISASARACPGAPRRPP